MHEIDKEKFGAFIAMLRKQKNMTQKDLAGKLMISDKAVSKWETGVSMPDTALLIPLSETLEVTVTELLMGRRMETALEPQEVEGVVKTAISYSEKMPARAWQEKGRWKLGYAAALIAGVAGLYLCDRMELLSEAVSMAVMLAAVFGAYFCFFVQLKLPRFYDENRIGAFSDGPVRMNIPGVNFNNNNWPYIVRVGRIWCTAAMAGFPVLALGLGAFYPAFWAAWETNVILVCLLGGLFIPMYIVGRKYQ